MSFNRDPVGSAHDKNADKEKKRNEVPQSRIGG